MVYVLAIAALHAAIFCKKNYLAVRPSVSVQYRHCIDTDCIHHPQTSRLIHVYFEIFIHLPTLVDLFYVPHLVMFSSPDTIFHQQTVVQHVNDIII